MTEIILDAGLLGDQGEAELVSWVVKDGEIVKKGQIVAEIETGKAVLEVPAPADGVLRISTALREVVETGSKIGIII